MRVRGGAQAKPGLDRRRGCEVCYIPSSFFNARHRITGRRGYTLNEDLALTLGLLFRALAPMRNRDNMRAVTEGIKAMEGEEIAYGLGMAMHRKNPRRVLKALRVLLTEAKR